MLSLSNKRERNDPNRALRLFRFSPIVLPPPPPSPASAFRRKDKFEQSVKITRQKLGKFRFTEQVYPTVVITDVKLVLATDQIRASRVPRRIADRDERYISQSCSPCKIANKLGAARSRESTRYSPISATHPFRRRSPLNVRPSVCVWVRFSRVTSAPVLRTRVKGLLYVLVRPPTRTRRAPNCEASSDYSDNRNGERRAKKSREMY